MNVINRAKMDALNLDLQWWEKMQTMVMVYCQNNQCPFEGSEQVGMSYYLSPLWVE